MKILIHFLLIFAFQGVTKAESKDPKKEDSLKWFNEASYCIAYELKPATEPPPKGLDQSLSHSPILFTRTHLNLLGLTTRTIRQKLLSKKQISDLKKATFKSKVYYPQKDCYSPHHLFIFYDEFGIALSCIEVCFSCNAIKYSRDLNAPPTPLTPDELKAQSEDQKDPFSDSGADDIRPLQTNGDLAAIAKICIQAGMGLGEFKSLEDFQKANQPIKK